jgi:hypothetical protein
MEAAAAAAAAVDPDAAAAAAAAAEVVVVDEPEAALPPAAAGSNPPILWEDDDRLAPYTVVEREGSIYQYYVVVEHPTDSTKLLAFCKLLPIKMDARKRDIVHHRKFDRASNSNLWNHLQATFPDLCARLKQEKKDEKKDAGSGGTKAVVQQPRGQSTLDAWTQLAKNQVILFTMQIDIAWC